VTALPSSIPKEARPFQGKRAGLATRMLAGGIDGLVLLALFAGSYLAWAAIIFLWNPSRFYLPTPSRPLIVVAGYVVGIGYLTLCWRISGRTYGDQVIGLKVVGRGGRPLGIGTALARAAFCALIPLGLLWAALSRENRSLADLLLRTSVLYDWRTAPSPVRAGEFSGAGRR
jgi:uncharacterized RDD family membrane protein YckC